MTEKVIKLRLSQRISDKLKEISEISGENPHEIAARLLEYQLDEGMKSVGYQTQKRRKEIIDEELERQKTLTPEESHSKWFSNTDIEKTGDI